jgi:hypothetical protein
MVYAAGGTPAFGDRSIPKVINRILHDEPDLGPLDGRLREVVAACLAKDPARRPTARQLMDELMGQGGTTVLTTPPGPSTARLPAPPPRRRGRLALVIAAVAAVLVALVAGIGALTAAGRPGHDSQAAISPSPVRTAHPSTHRRPSPSRTPSHRPATPKPARANPYTPQRLCGGGYRVIGMHGLGGAKAYLLYNGHAGVNCVVTMVARSTGKTSLSASLVVKGGGRESRTGAFPYFAGPVRLPAKGKCVMWGGASKTARWTSGWSHCGR